MHQIDYFKEYYCKSVDKHYWITPSQVVLKSFHLFEVEKPESVNIRTFEWLRAIAEQEIKDYKSILCNK